MKKLSLLFTLVVGFWFGASWARADQLDDVIASMRSGASAPANKKDILKGTSEAAYKAYTDSIVDLYLQEIKFSIIDPDDNGGWPFRSFLVESDFYSRKHLTNALKERFDKKPDALLAYALVCPALYVSDTALVDRLERYLKDNDPFLYKLEQIQIAQYWRPFIAAARKLIVVPQLLSKMLPYIASNGADRELPASIANPLGLSASGATWPYRSIGVNDSDAQHVHGFAVGRGSDPDIVLSQRLPDSLHVFRANREGKVVTAMFVSLPSKQIKMLAPAEAQPEFDSNWDYWCGYIDDPVISAGVK
jgi:hypothetical protein